MSTLYNPHSFAVFWALAYLELEAYLKPCETLTRHVQNPAIGHYSAILLVKNYNYFSKAPHLSTFTGFWICLSLNLYSLRIHWRLVFWYVKVYVFWKFIQYTIHWDKTQIFKKILLDKINVTKIALIFLLQAPTYHSFTFN